MAHIEKFWFLLFGSAFRYVFFAGLAYSIFYIWKRKNWSRFKIQASFPKTTTVRNEVKYSLLSILIFGVVIYLVLFGPLKKYTLIYTNIHDHSAWYFWFSVLAAIFLHDTYFYWTHRLMHWKKIFRYVHYVHHKSHNPTPWAAFSFHPLEALVEIGVVPLIAFLLPIHPWAFSIFGLYMILMNVLGHLGYELFPQKFIQTPVLKWMNTSTHHNMHHHYSKCNYGLYFNIWDRLLKTNHDHYEDEFIKVARHARSEKDNKNIQEHSISIQS